MSPCSTVLPIRRASNVTVLATDGQTPGPDTGKSSRRSIWILSKQVVDGNRAESGLRCLRQLFSLVDTASLRQIPAADRVKARLNKVDERERKRERQHRGKRMTKTGPGSLGSDCLIWLETVANRPHLLSQRGQNLLVTLLRTRQLLLTKKNGTQTYKCKSKVSALEQATLTRTLHASHGPDDQKLTIASNSDSAAQRGSEFA